MNAVLGLIICFGALVGAQPIDGYAAPAAYARPSYAAPSYVSDVIKVSDFDYAVNDYYGNEQTRQEHVEPGKQIGSWSARMADGAMETVSYEANDYGNLAHVIIRKEEYAAPSNQGPAYVAPKMHYNYEEKNIYVPKTYAAPTLTYQSH